MIFYYLILFITTVLSATFAWLPKITTLPTVFGIDIDAALSSGVGMVYSLSIAIWPIRDVLIGAIVLLGYYAIKLVLRFFLGHRAPA